MTEQNMHVPVKKLVDFMIAALVKMDVPREDAGIIADVLITSDLWGVRSHGVAHLKMYHERMKAGLQLPVTKCLKGEQKEIHIMTTDNRLSQWVESYASELYSWAFHKVSDSELAKYLGQDTFLAAAEKIDGFKGESTPKTWLFSIPPQSQLVIVQSPPRP